MMKKPVKDIKEIKQNQKTYQQELMDNIQENKKLKEIGNKKMKESMKKVEQRKFIENRIKRVEKGCIVEEISEWHLNFDK